MSYICYAQSTDSDHPSILLRKPRIRALHNNPRIANANLGSARNHLGSRNETSAIRGNKPTIDRARKAARPSAATWVRCRGWPSCFACAIDRGFVDADGRAALRAPSIVGLLPRMAEVWLRDPRRLRWRRRGRRRGRRRRQGKQTQKLVSKRMEKDGQIRGLRSKILRWSESVLCAYI